MKGQKEEEVEYSRRRKRRFRREVDGGMYIRAHTCIYIYIYIYMYVFLDRLNIDNTLYVYIR